MPMAALAQHELPGLLVVADDSAARVDRRAKLLRSTLAVEGTTSRRQRRNRACHERALVVDEDSSREVGGSQSMAAESR
jgi:hypothetical protein